MQQTVGQHVRNTSVAQNQCAHWLCVVTSNLCILYFKYNREHVFCILDLRVEVFDKSISNTFLKSIVYFVF